MFQVNSARLTSFLAELARIGATSQGGITRYALSDEDWQARQWLIDTAGRFGFAHRLDAVGNLFIYRPEWQGETIMLVGSHLDTVPNGGGYDGALGVLGALECLIRLQEEDIKPNHCPQVVVWTEEEGSRFRSGLVGSRAYIGDLPASELAEQDSQGCSLAEALANRGLIGLTMTPDAKARTHAYLELHIEQGGILERSGLQIGVVTGIVGIRRYDVTLTGQANHAGTTPMALRRDALVGAAAMVVETEQILHSGDFPEAVATVGQLQVYPGAVNVVPGQVRFALEVRDLESQVMDEVARRVLGAYQQVAWQRGLRIEWQQTSDVVPAPLHPRARAGVAQAAQGLGYSYREMPSGAGHDAQHLAQICPTGMIFVPSQGGISHSPQEFTAAEDCVRGANVLLNSILMIDQM